MKTVQLYWPIMLLGPLRNEPLANSRLASSVYILIWDDMDISKVNFSGRFINCSKHWLKSIIHWTNILTSKSIWHCRSRLYSRLEELFRVERYGGKDYSIHSLVKTFSCLYLDTQIIFTFTFNHLSCCPSTSMSLSLFVSLSILLQFLPSAMKCVIVLIAKVILVIADASIIICIIDM